MTELVLRLRRGGEIVGYIMIRDGDIYGYKGKELPIAFTAWLAWGPVTMIQHDSFDIGMKEDGEWHFTDDKAMISGKMHTLVFTEDHHDFALHADEGVNLAFWYLKECGQVDIEWVKPIHEEWPDL